jgi:aarF domain-containing kinase
LVALPSDKSIVRLLNTVLRKSRLTLLANLRLAQFDPKHPFSPTTDDSVVVKVRYPNVERILRGDVRTITMFAQVAQPVHVPALEEVEKQFMTEFDYVQEGEQLETVRKNLIQAGLAGPGKLCRVPKAYLEYCTTRVLVMEELVGGVKLADGLKEEIKFQAAREGKSVDEYFEEVKQKEQLAKEKGEEVTGPTSEEYDFYISILKKKRAVDNFGRRLHNSTVGWVPGSQTKPIEDKSSLPINHAKMIDDLPLIHGHEILVDGFFNGKSFTQQWRALGGSNINLKICDCRRPPSWKYHAAKRTRR